MQVNPLVSGAQDRHLTLAIHFRLLSQPWRHRSGSRRKRARAILVCVDSSELEPDDWSVCIRAGAPELTPAITRAAKVAAKGHQDFLLCNAT